MILELLNISYNFSHKGVLRNLNIKFQDGKLYAITGDNGAGKSTLANIICGELKPVTGTILIDGTPVILDSPKTAIQNGICYVHQFPLIADSLTVKENLLLGLSKKGKELLRGELAFLQNIKLNTPARNLSSDQRVFVALQSAMLKSPSLLLLDEPTALLDDTQREFLYTKLKELTAKGLTVIVITHYLEEANKYCDVTLKLKNGALNVR